MGLWFDDVKGEQGEARSFKIYPQIKPPNKEDTHFKKQLKICNVLDFKVLKQPRMVCHASAT